MTYYEERCQGLLETFPPDLVEALQRQVPWNDLTDAHRQFLADKLREGFTPPEVVGAVALGRKTPIVFIEGK